MWCLLIYARDFYLCGAGLRQATNLSSSITKQTAGNHDLGWADCCRGPAHELKISIGNWLIITMGRPGAPL